MEENGGFQGLWIPREIWLLPMGIVQKNLLAELIALSKNKNGCYASNQYLAEFMQLGVDSIKKYIKNLKDAGYIDVQGGNYSRCITINWQRINGGKSSPMCSEHGEVLLNVSFKSCSSILKRFISHLAGHCSQQVARVLDKFHGPCNCKFCFVVFHFFILLYETVSGRTTL